MCSFSLDNSASSGPSACAGCADPACLVLDSVSLSPAGGLDAVNVIEPLLRQRVTWQAAADASGLGCAAGSAPKQSTWGGLKSLYH